MKELIPILDRAAKAYYQGEREVMDNYEYDKLYEELEQLEKESGIVLSGSPTTKVGYEVLSELPKEAHETGMLSLDKTKNKGELKQWLKEKDGVLSWKLDGLTIVLTYEKGRLIKAVTRGNGEVGEVVTNNAKVFSNIPLTITYKETLVLRGEAVITYSDFEKINKELEEEEKYKNPRNLCSGSVRQLNNEITAKRNVHFFAFALVRADHRDFENSREKQLIWLESLGFEIVPYKKVSGDNVEKTVENLERKIPENDFPSDGLVLVYDDIDYGRSLGSTSKFPRDAIAFKWADQTKETILKEIEWSPSRTGLINPVAIFEPVELEGTTVSRASVHNISVMKALELGIGDRISVYKANMIIPQIGENFTRSRALFIPKECPACGGLTEIRQVNDVQYLYCTNPTCQAKKIKAFTLFVSRDGMNVEGLSEATLEKFLGKGFLREFADIFHLSQHKEEIMEMEGFGEKSYKNLLDNIEKARTTTLPKVIYSLGILNIGLANAKMICKEFGYDVEKLLKATKEELSEIDGVGEVIASAFTDYFEKEENKNNFQKLLQELIIEKEEEVYEEAVLKGKSFVITGSLNHFPNRNALKTFIEQRGGKVTGSVTGKTSFLINNDSLSSSGKNKKAKELNIAILSEEDFLEMVEKASM